MCRTSEGFVQVHGGNRTMETTTTIKFSEDTEKDVDKFLTEGVYQKLYDAMLAVKAAGKSRAFIVCKDESVRLY